MTTPTLDTRPVSELSEDERRALVEKLEALARQTLQDGLAERDALCEALADHFADEAQRDGRIKP